MAFQDSLCSYTRRGFLRQAARASVGISAASVIRDLRLISTASAQGSPPEDYKALCCIFLAGGNDSDNTMVDLGAGKWNNYKALRQKLAIPASDADPAKALMALQLANAAGTSNHDYGLHPALLTMAGSVEQGIKKLFETNKAAAIFNVGPLIAPVTRDDYERGTGAALPPQLFSHSDQSIHWQTSWPDHPPSTGWAGRMADLLNDGVPSFNSGLVSLNTSIAGTNVFQTGADFNQFHVSSRGAVTLGSSLGGATEWFGGWHRGLKNVSDANSGNTNLQRAAYAGVLTNAMATGENLNAVLADTTWNPTFPATALGSQLKMVARMIEARGRLGMKRQTFFTQVGGYDTHADQVHDGSPHLGTHADLLRELSDAVFAFQAAMENLGIQDNVVSFTASDFGRTFRANGFGSDHGWGGHHFVFGGSGGTTGVVKGGRTYGSLPDQLILGRSEDDAGAGRWIPKISVDEYSATLAKWFGVSSTDMSTVFPNLGNFGPGDLGFLRS